MTSIFSEVSSADDLGVFLEGKFCPMGFREDDPRPCAGACSWLQQFYADPMSPVYIDSPRTALNNLMFWLIHSEWGHFLNALH